MEKVLSLKNLNYRKKAEAEALKPPKIPAPKPKKFHEILRNDEIILNKPLKANCQIKEKIPSQRIISKSHSVSHKKENNINSTNVFVPIQSINQEFNKLSQKSKDIRSETNSQTEPILNLKEKNLIVNQGDDVILNDLNERIKIIYSLAEVITVCKVMS